MFYDVVKSSFVLVLIIQSAMAESFLTKEDFPFMVYLYYHGESALEWNNATFFRGGVLVTLQHAVTAALRPLGGSRGGDETADGGGGEESGGEGSGAPCSLVVMAGAAVSSSNRSLLQVGEQEREVSFIIRPRNQSTDIAVVKVLKPFVQSTSVALTQLLSTHNFSVNMTCDALLYVNKDSGTPERFLHREPVKVLMGSCSDPFQQDRTICANEIEQKEKSPLKCQITVGGPLICEREVVAIQNFPQDMECKPLKSYHILSFWEKFLECAVKNDCSIAIYESVCIASQQQLEQYITSELKTTPKDESNTSNFNSSVNENINQETNNITLRNNTLLTDKEVFDSKKPIDRSDAKDDSMLKQKQELMKKDNKKKTKNKKKGKGKKRRRGTAHL